MSKKNYSNSGEHNSPEVGYLMYRFEYFLDQFAPMLAPVIPMVDPSRTRRVLSNGLFTFVKRAFYRGEKRKILFKKT